MARDLKDKNGNWMKKVDGELSLSYQVWYSMMQRCIYGGRIQLLYDTYFGCTASEEFSNFQTFTDWHSKQIGYGEYAYDLDKDLLNEQNKIYSADTCVLIPHALNIFFIHRKSKDTDLPRGVCLQAASGKYKAQLRASGELVYLGIYKTPEEAYEVYKEAKEADARRWAERLKRGDYKVDSRVIYAMENWKVIEPTY